jgi:hypothetical protein
VIGKHAPRPRGQVIFFAAEIETSKHGFTGGINDESGHHDVKATMPW